MRCRQITAIFAAAALMIGSVGCMPNVRQNPKQTSEIREFTGFYAARLHETDEDNEIRQIIAEKTGALVRQEWDGDPDSCNRRFNSMMISGDYPDFLAPDAGNCQKLIKANAFIPIDQYWDDYPNIRALYTDAQWNRVRASDGHIYYIPLFSAMNGADSTPTHSGEAFWLQVKVLAWDGYPTIRTPYEYFDLLERYLAANPTDANGDPYYGYEIEANEAWFFALDNPPMFLDGYPNDGCCIVDPDTHEAKDYNLSPTAKRWFALLNEEYQKGVIDQECFLLNGEQYYEKLRSGRVLGMVDQQWNFSNAVSDLPADCTYIPLGLTIDAGIEEHYCDKMTFNNSEGVGVSTSCKEPRAALQFLNDLLEPEILNLRFWGVEEVDYSVREDGIFYQTEEQYERWNDAAYQASHLCQYDYMPFYQGMAPDGKNAFTATNQPNIYYSHLPKEVQECFSAYDVQTFREFLNVPGDNPPWYPMWSFSNTVTEDTDYGKIMNQIDAAKHKYLPLLVMSSDFEATWAEYTTAYGEINTQLYFDALTAEVQRRIGG